MESVGLEERREIWRVVDIHEEMWRDLLFYKREGMKFNIANPATSQQKTIEIDDENRFRSLMDKRMGHEVDGDFLGEEFKGYKLKITGGNDKQGFPMKQGILVNGRVRLLMGKGHSTYKPRRAGEKRRKSVRGCIVGPDMAAIALAIEKQGDQGIPGLTDKDMPRRLGPKRASKLRKLFKLTKKDDIRRYVMKREVKRASGKTFFKRANIQRLITEKRLRRKKVLLREKKEHIQAKRDAKTSYEKLVSSFLKEKRDKAKALRKKKDAAKAAQEPSPVKQQQQAKK